MGETKLTEVHMYMYMCTHIHGVHGSSQKKKKSKKPPNASHCICYAYTTVKSIAGHVGLTLTDYTR